MHHEPLRASKRWAPVFVVKLLDLAVENVLNICLERRRVVRGCSVQSVPPFQVIQIQRVSSNRETLGFRGEAPRFANVDNIARLIENRDVSGARFYNRLEKSLPHITLLNNLFRRRGS